MLPIPKGTKEQERKGTRSLTCPYCDDSPFVKLFETENITHLNTLFNKERKNIPILGSDGFIHERTEDYNYEKGCFCEKCKTIWLWEGNVCDTYVGKNVPRVKEVVIIRGKACPNFIPIKDKETGEYMPLLNPSAPLIKKQTKHFPF